MGSWDLAPKNQARSGRSRRMTRSRWANVSLQMTDIGFVAILFVAPLFFGGRHPLGRLVFIGLACSTSLAWFSHQALLGKSKWVHSWANFLGLAAIALLAAQLIPLSSSWLEWLAPRDATLLPLWSSASNSDFQLGEWQTLSLSPSATRVALATLISYFLLFVTATQRLQSLADIRSLFQKIALSAVFISAFGLIQYFTSNGLFFWFYEYPYSTTLRVAKAGFTCSNHFAHYIVLGGGVLLAWAVLQHQTPTKSKNLATSPVAFAAGLLLVVLAVLWSGSRGGALSLAIIGTISLTCYQRRGLISPRFLYSGVLLGLLMIGLLSMHGYSEVVSQLDDFTSGSINELDNGSGRRKIWAANLAAIAEGGLFGAGAGTHRVIYPVYLPEFLQVDYTHAESGYLQIGSENGFLGLGILLLVVLLVSSWCWKAMHSATSNEHLILAIATTATLAANLVHSLIDFVWFIPACMSLTILLAAAALRLAQLATEPIILDQPTVTWSKTKWLSFNLTSAVASLWCVSTIIGPGLAAPHWDQYQLSVISGKQISQERLTTTVEQPLAETNLIAQTKTSIYHLQQVLMNDPHAARAHLRLAKAYLRLFDLQQQSAANSMTADQIRDAAFASKFATSQELREWLNRAFGKSHNLLYRAHNHTTQSLKLCPLLGKGYLQLSTLCFLNGDEVAAMHAYIAQARNCRPYDDDLLYEVGRQHWLLGQKDKTIEVWQEIYPSSGLHQLRIAKFLTRYLSGDVFTHLFAPDWGTLRYVWQQYVDQNRHSDCLLITEYAAIQARHADSTTNWLSLSVMQRKSNDNKGCLASLHRAHQLSPNDFTVRRQYGKQLLRTGNFQDAQTHLRWCLARQPGDQQLRSELAQAVRAKFQRITTASRTTASFNKP